MLGDWQITRGDAPPREPVFVVAERLLKAGAVSVVDRPNGGWELAVLDGGVSFRVVCNAARRGWCCECGTAFNQGGGCPHLHAAKTWLRQQDG